MRRKIPTPLRGMLLARNWPVVSLSNTNSMREDRWRQRDVTSLTNNPFTLHVWGACSTLQLCEQHDMIATRNSTAGEGWGDAGWLRCTPGVIYGTGETKDAKFSVCVWVNRPHHASSHPSWEGRGTNRLFCFHLNPNKPFLKIAQKKGKFSTFPLKGRCPETNHPNSKNEAGWKQGKNVSIGCKIDPKWRLFSVGELVLVQIFDLA